MSLEERIDRMSDFGPALRELVRRAREIDMEAVKYPHRIEELRKRANLIRRATIAMLSAIDMVVE